MIKEVTRYETSNGQTFESQDRAILHEDRLCHTLEQFILQEGSCDNIDCGDCPFSGTGICDTHIVGEKDYRTVAAAQELLAKGKTRDEIIKEHRNMGLVFVKVAACEPCYFFKDYCRCKYGHGPHCSGGHWT